jgi:superkiller protein 3
MSNLLIQNLKKLFSDNKYGQIIRALRNDAAVWSALQNTETTKRMIDLAGSDYSRWSPAFVALVNLGISDQFPKLITEEVSLEGELKYQASAELENILSNQIEKNLPLPIENAGLAALALRERWLILKQSDISLFKVESNLSAWKTITACLIGLLPNPEDLVADLLTSGSADLHELAIHGTTSNPQDAEQLSKVFLLSVLELAPMERIDILRQCAQLNPKLADYLAVSLIKRLEMENKPSSNPFKNIQKYVEMAELLKITGQYEEAIPALENLWRTTTSLQTDLTSQLAQAATKANDQDAAELAIEKIAKLSEKIPMDVGPDVTLAQIQTGKLDPKLIDRQSKAAPSKQATPAMLLAKAQLSLNNGDQNKAQAFASQAFEATNKFLGSKESLPSNISNTLTPDFFYTLVECLINLELVFEATQLSERILAKLPNNDEILNLHSKAQFLSGETAKSIESAFVATALAPNNQQYRRNLVELLSNAEHWQDAVKEVNTYLSLLENPTPADYILAATCYLHSDQLDDAAMIAKKGLAEDSDNGKLHALLGRIYRQDSKTAEAVKHYNKAILINPQTPEYWSELAMMYQADGNVDKAEEILNSAFEVIPNSAHLHLQLGQIHISNNKTTEALSEFNQAKQFISPQTKPETRQEIYALLGKHLQDQGYYQEALAALEEGHQAFPVNPTIAHLFGKALFLADRTDEALSAYQIANQTTTTDADLLIDYSEALLSVGGKSAEAAEMIERALVIEPDNQTGGALLGEAAAQSGDHHHAIKIFQNALQTELASDPEWLIKLTTKLAQSAFEIDQPEIAITFLQESLQKTPDNLAAKQSLCQAYILTDLSRDALRLLEEILEQHSQNLEILMWASDQAIKINNLDFASEILNQAKQIAPQKADLMVRLGYIQLEKGEEAEARTTFGQLFSAENVDVKNLRLAAQALIDLGDISSSIPYLEKALELSDYKSSDLLKELTNLHLKSGNDQAALETVQKQIKIQPMLPGLYVTLAEILSKLGESKPALNSMLKALELAPDSAQLHTKTAFLLRKNHDLSGGLSHIKQALQAEPADPVVQTKAAELFQACFLTEEALSVTSTLLMDKQPSMEALLIRAEILLDQFSEKNLDQVEEVILRAVQLNSAHPRLLALQSRIESKTGDGHKARRILEQAMLNFSAYESGGHDSINLSAVFLSLAKAMLDLNKWDAALFFAREAQQLTPQEPAPFLLQAIIWTKRAEAHFRSSSIQMGSKTAASIATHPLSQAAFETAIDSAERYLPDQAANETISRWRTRGELALLNKDPKTAVETLSDSPEDFAALLTAFNRAKIVPDVDQTLYHQAPDVIFQRALLNTQLDPEHALSQAESLVQSRPNNPEYAALYALLAKQAGHDQVALNSIEHAIRLVSGEPLWHALAGELHLGFTNYSDAISHFDQAHNIDKNNPAHQFNLGKALAYDNAYSKAIPALEQAAEKAPLEADYWITLAQAYHHNSNTDQAIGAVKKALKLSPNNLQIVLAAAEIVTETDEDALGKKLVVKALSMPTNQSAEMIQICELLVRLDQVDQALGYVNEKIELAVDQIPLLIQRAKLIGLQQGNQEKLNLLIQLAKENSKNPLIFAQLTDAYIESNNPEEAIRSAQFALKYADNLLDLPRRAKLHYQLGVLLRQSGQLDQALHQLTQTLQFTPNFLAAHLEIGETLTQRKEFEKALEHYQTAISIAPNDPRAYKEAGLLLKEAKDYLGAETMFRQAYAHDSNDLFIQRQLAAVIALALIHQPKTTG